MDRFGRHNIVVELSTQLLPTDDEDNDALADLAHDARSAGGRHHRRALRRARRRAGWPRRWRRSAAGAAWTRPTRSCRRVRGRTCGPGRRWRRCSPGTRPRCQPRRGSVEECSFDLHLVAPKLPPYDVPPGHDENSHLRQLTMTGAARRYGPPENRPDAYRADRKGTEDHRRV